MGSVGFLRSFAIVENCAGVLSYKIVLSMFLYVFIAILSKVANCFSGIQPFVDLAARCPYAQGEFGSCLG